MNIKIEGLNYFIERKSNSSHKESVVFLHGFTGNSSDWDFIITKLPNEFEPISIDLLGHGKTSSPKNIDKYSFESQIHLLDIILQKLNVTKPILVGYSMGGRLALSYSFKHPNKVQAVVLESTSFGLNTLQRKEARIKSDKILSNRIMDLSIEEFINHWMNIPLFNSQKKLPLEIRNEQRENKISSNNVLGLTNSLLGFGTGKMNNYFYDLESYKANILLVTGSLDSKFTEIAKEVNIRLPNSAHKIVENAGHNVHLEKPKEFLKFLKSFILKSVKQ